MNEAKKLCFCRVICEAQPHQVQCPKLKCHQVHRQEDLIHGCYPSAQEQCQALKPIWHSVISMLYSAQGLKQLFSYKLTL